MRQATLATAGFERYRKPTRRAAFLAEMDRVVPWAELCALIAPVYPQPGKGRRPVGLEAAVAYVDRYDLLILDDLSYVHKDHAETSVLFELIGARYERRSMLITANQPFADWNKVFPDHAMMIAAIDRLVHHSIIFEMTVESYRRRGALDRKDRPAAVNRQRETASA